METSCECPICYEAIVAKATGRAELSCGHAFHIRCVTDWFATDSLTCPMCRKGAVDLEVPTKKAKVKEEPVDLSSWGTFLSSIANNTIYDNNTVPVSTSGGLYNEYDILTVIQQTGASREVAIEALRSQQGDLVDAIMSLQPEDIYA